MPPQFLARKCPALHRLQIPSPHPDRCPACSTALHEIRLRSILAAPAECSSPIDTSWLLRCSRPQQVKHCYGHRQNNPDSHSVSREIEPVQFRCRRIRQPDRVPVPKRAVRLRQTKSRDCYGRKQQAPTNRVSNRSGGSFRHQLLAVKESNVIKYPGSRLPARCPR